MTQVQQRIFVAGCLIAIAIASTVVGILIHRGYPDFPLLTLIGPLSAIAAVFALRCFLFTRSP